MPKRKGMSTSTMILLFAFIVLILAALVIFLGLNGITSSASTAFIIWWFISGDLGFLMLYFAATSGSIIMIGIFLVLIGAILVLINFLMNR